MPVLLQLAIIVGVCAGVAALATLADRSFTRLGDWRREWMAERQERKQIERDRKRIALVRDSTSEKQKRPALRGD